MTSNEAGSMANSAASLMVTGSTLKPSYDARKPKPKPTPPDRTEKFEIKGRCKHLDNNDTSFLSFFNITYSAVST